MACNQLKMGSFHSFRHRKQCRIKLRKIKFWPMFDHFLVPKQFIFKAFWDFRRAKAGHDELKTRQKTLILALHVTLIFFKKKDTFLPPVDLVDPFWHPPLWATSCSLP